LGRCEASQRSYLIIIIIIIIIIIKDKIIGWAEQSVRRIIYNYLTDVPFSNADVLINADPELFTKFRNPVTPIQTPIAELSPSNTWNEGLKRIIRRAAAATSPALPCDRSPTRRAPGVRQAHSTGSGQKK
jgi:hypothetical protein